MSIRLKERYNEEKNKCACSLTSENCAVAEPTFTVDQHIFVSLAPGESDDSLVVDFPALFIIR